MNASIINSLLDEFKSGKLTSQEVVLKIVESNPAERKNVVKHIVEKWRCCNSLDWTYRYSDDAVVYANAEARWEEVNAKAIEDRLLAMVLAIVSKEVHASSPPLIKPAIAGWGSTTDELSLDGRMIDRNECVEISYGLSFRKRYGFLEDDGTILIIDPPRVTKDMVITAATNGVPVVKWRDWGFASAYADSEEFYGWRLLVRPYDRALTKGAIFVVPTITDTRRIHRAGKIKHIAEISGQPLIWAKSYYAKSKTVKYAIEDGVVAKVANYSGSTYEEWQEMSEENSRAKAAKRMVALINQFEGA